MYLNYQNVWPGPKTGYIVMPQQYLEWPYTKSHQLEHGCQICEVKILKSWYDAWAKQPTNHSTPYQSQEAYDWVRCLTQISYHDFNILTLQIWQPCSSWWHYSTCTASLDAVVALRCSRFSPQGCGTGAGMNHVINHFILFLCQNCPFLLLFFAFSSSFGLRLKIVLKKHSNLSR